MKLSILILTYNRQDDLRRCLQSIYDQDTELSFEVIVVDNASTDNTGQMLKSDFPDVLYVLSKENLGVCGGRNLGFGSVSGDVILNLDDDCELIDKDFLDSLPDLIKGLEPNWAIVSFKMLHPQLGEYTRGIPSRDKSIISDDMTEVPYFVEGGCIMRKSIFDIIGRYPKEYFYAMESSDLALRIIENGYSLYYYTRLRIMHHESIISRPSWRRYYFDYRNRIWFVTKYLPLRFALSHIILWGGYNFLNSLRYGYLSHFIDSILDSFKRLDVYLAMRPMTKIKPSTIAKLKSLKGRLYY